MTFEDDGGRNCGRHASRVPTRSVIARIAYRDVTVQ